MKLSTEIIESLWLYDGKPTIPLDILRVAQLTLFYVDVMEDVDHAGAVEVHASVRDTLTGAQKPSKKSMIATLFKDFGARLNQMDKQGAPRVLASLKTYLDNYDSQKTPFNTIQKYTEYRILNVGYGFVSLQHCNFVSHIC